MSSNFLDRHFVAKVSYVLSYGCYYFFDQMIILRAWVSNVVVDEVDAIEVLRKDIYIYILTSSFVGN